MIELSRHIEKLLLFHDCVILPDFGGFITQYVSAAYIPEDGVFQPPYRIVAFNECLSMNDGLLIQSYMQSYDIGYDRAVCLMANAISDLKHHLYEQGTVQIGSLGSLKINTLGGYTFVPQDGGVVTPSLYGLDSYTLLNNTKSEDTRRYNVNDKKDSNYILRVNKNFANYFVAAVVSLIFYFGWAPSLSETTGKSYASMLPSLVVTTQSHELASLETNFQEVAIAPSHDSEKKSEIKKSGYTLVLASCIPLKNANSFVDELVGLGYNKAEVLEQNKMTRVVFGTYSTEDEAFSELKKMRKISHEYFGSAWVLKI